jgi:hypothetical protein
VDRNFINLVGEYIFMDFITKDRSDYAARYQFVEMFALSALGFLIPFAFGHPQLLVGILVNAFIIRAASTLPINKALPIVFTPTIGVLARGLLFGPFTVYILLLTPFIWAGNYLLLWAFTQKRNFPLTLGAASIAKAGLLYGSAFILYTAGLIPAIMLPAMGILQLTTALAGGILAYGELKAEKLLK